MTGVLAGVDSKWLSAHKLAPRLRAWADKYGGKWRTDAASWAEANGPAIDPDAAKEQLGYLAAWPDCDVCGKGVEFIASIGQQIDYEQSPARVCLPCLREALAEAEAAYLRHQRREFTAAETRG